MSLRSVATQLRQARAGQQARWFSAGSHQLQGRLAVIGSGQMGMGIALVAAQRAQIPTIVVDSSQQAIDRALKLRDKLLDKDVAKQKISKDEVAGTKERMSTTTNIEDIADVDYVIEAVPEIPDLKFKIFSQLARMCKPTTILGSNTSSISITRIAASTTEDPRDLSRPSRVIGMHFMNPVPVLKGVEIITGLQTSQATVDAATDLCKRMGKVISQSVDSPGFLANRILMPYINEAIICLETGVGDKDDIDAIMKNGTNVPMGPLQLADFIGLDTCLAIMKILYQETSDSKYRPAVLLKKMVDAGWLGKKVGKGFYDY